MNQLPENQAFVAEGVPNRQGGSWLRFDLVEHYWREAKRRKWLIAAIMTAFFVLALIMTLLMTPQYTASTRIEISRDQENVTNVQGLESEDAGNSLEFYQTQYSLLEARSLASRVARTLNLASDATFIEAYDLGDSFGETADSSIDDRIETVTDILQRDMEVDPIRGSSLVDITYTSPNAALSAKIADTFAAQFTEATLDRRFGSTKDARDFLEDQLATLRERLEKSERDLVNYAADKRIIELSTSEGSDGATRTEQTLAGADLEALNSQLAEATGARIAAESELRAGAGANANLLSNSAINGLRQQRAALASEYARMLQKFEPGYPAAQAIKAQLDALDRSISAEEARVNSGTQREFRQAAARERELRERVEALKGDLISQRRDSIQYTIYQREVDTNRELYDALLQRYKEIGVAGVGSNNIAIVDRAEIPGGPSSPNLILNLLLSLVAGGFVSALVVVGLNLADQSVRDPQDVDRLFGLPLLGSIPTTTGAVLAEEIKDRKTEFSEAYLSVKTSLSFLTDHGVPRAFMLTSTGPNEGKSISSLALAQILGRSGKRTILVDADMRNPSVAGLFDEKNGAGLSNYLSGQSNIAELVLDSELPNLAIMHAGPQPPNAAELLSGQRMTELVRELLGTYDHVVIDSPPVLGLADAPLLSTSVEGVIIAIEANRYKLRTIENSIRRLRHTKTPLLGAIVTKVDQRNSAYGYGTDYGYGYSYGSEADEPSPAGRMS